MSPSRAWARISIPKQELGYELKNVRSLRDGITHKAGCAKLSRPTGYGLRATGSERRGRAALSSQSAHSLGDCVVWGSGYSGSGAPVGAKSYRLVGMIVWVPPTTATSFVGSRLSG